MINILIVTFIMALLLLIWYVLRHRNRRAFIRSHTFHPGVMARFKKAYPHLDNTQISMVSSAMLDYFEICSIASGKFVSMPSQAVDDLWHEFILFTRPYERFCNKAFGRYLHHTPTEAMASPTQAGDGIKRTWKLSCKLARIDPKNPTALPLLFAIDSLLSIENGFHYTLDCSRSNRGDYCASHIGCGSGCGSCGGDSSCGSGCGGGD